MPLTESQTMAADHREGPCLVLAVPGAGKTTVLIERIRRLTASGVSPSSIASITFSRRQAKDMRARYEKLYGPAPELTFSTIHAFCYRILLQDAAARHETLHLIESSEEYSKKRVVAEILRQRSGRSATDDELEDFFRIDGFIKNSLTDYAGFRKKTGESFPHFEEVSREYSRFKRERSLIDFDDMLIHTLDIFRRRPEILEALRRRFTYLQVDEAQDTSAVQMEILRQMAAPRNNLFLVADDDQAIYGFRGADPGELLLFPKRYPDCKIITMQDNHRSGKHIVRMSGQLIQNNRQRFDKVPQTDEDDDNRIEVLFSKSAEAQYRRILRDLPGDLERGDCAILFRNNISAVGLIDSLSRAGIPFRNDSPLPDFYRHPVLYDVLAILEFAVHPTDLEPFSRIYYKLGCYLKKDFIREAAAGNPYEDVLDRIADCPGAQNTFYREKLEHLRREFRLIRNSSLPDAIERIDRWLGYGDYLDEKARDDHRSSGSDRRVLETIRSISKGLSSPDSLAARIEELKRAHRGSEDARLTISTIHGAKGLEFDTVWVIDLIQNEFPSAHSLEYAAEGKGHLLEEERRLFYVAMTRAKTKLRLIGRTPSYSGGELSLFLREITKRKGAAKKGKPAKR